MATSHHPRSRRRPPPHLTEEQRRVRIAAMRARQEAQVASDLRRLAVLG
jgi:hypothetical protein